MPTVIDTQSVLLKINRLFQAQFDIDGREVKVEAPSVGSLLSCAAVSREDVEIFRWADFRSV